MRACAQCGKATANPKYCSRSCSATSNNRGVRRHGVSPGECRQCQTPLTTHHQAFCSSVCHQEAMAESRVKRWLATGLPGQHTLTGAIRDWIMMQQNGVCAICGRDPVWNGATLVFVLDHIDGDGSNHVRANVRMICPNCDSQLPTFKARNRGKGRHYRRERYRAGKSY